MVTWGAHCKSLRAGRGSNQCAVPSCSATKRVSGGSPKRSRGHTDSIIEPIFSAIDVGTSRGENGTSAAWQIPCINSRTVRGSPFAMTYALPAHVAPGAAASTAATNAVTALSI